MDLTKRQDVPVEETWDLTALFPNDEAWQAALAEVKNKAPSFLLAKNLGNALNIC